MDIFEVRLSKKAQRELQKIPFHIAFKLQIWIDGIKIYGLREMRKHLGFHDEKLKGNRHAQYSIRLNKGYRAIYIIDKHQEIHFVAIIEVNKHEY